MSITCDRQLNEDTGGLGIPFTLILHCFRVNTHDTPASQSGILTNKDDSPKPGYTGSIFFRGGGRLLTCLLHAVCLVNSAHPNTYLIKAGRERIPRRDWEFCCFIFMS
jgi:hypothetical protein